jgi:hypothetical protein
MHTVQHQDFRLGSAVKCAAALVAVEDRGYPVPPRQAVRREELSESASLGWPGNELPAWKERYNSFREKTGRSKERPVRICPSADQISERVWRSDLSGFPRKQPALDMYVSAGRQVQGRAYDAVYALGINDLTVSQCLY